MLAGARILETGKTKVKSRIRSILGLSSINRPRASTVQADNNAGNDQQVSYHLAQRHRLSEKMRSKKRIYT